MIALDAVPDSAQDFSFSGGGSSGGAGTVFLTFLLDDDAEPTLGSSQTFADQNAGSYTFRQDALPAGWELSALTCTDPDGGSSTNLATATAQIDLDAGETVTCTFTNREQDTAPPVARPARELRRRRDERGGCDRRLRGERERRRRSLSAVLTCAPASGSLFAIGSTTVTCTAADASGNTTVGSFTVSVRGATAQIAGLIAKTLAFLGFPGIADAVTGRLEAIADAPLSNRRRDLHCDSRLRDRRASTAGDPADADGESRAPGRRGPNRRGRRLLTARCFRIHEQRSRVAP